MAGGPNKNYAKVGHRGQGRGRVTYFWFLGFPRISGMAEARHSSTCSVVHSMQPLPNYFASCLFARYKAYACSHFFYTL